MELVRSSRGKTTRTPSAWQIALNVLLNRLGDQLKRSPRIAVVAIGDGQCAGPSVARGLLACPCALDTGRMLVVRAGHAPENVACEIRGFAPDLILMVDTLDSGGPPGRVSWVAVEKIVGPAVHAHSLPLFMLARFLQLEFHCEVRLLGIQPAPQQATITNDCAMAQAIDAVVDEILDGICKSHTRTGWQNLPYTRE